MRHRKQQGFPAMIQCYARAIVDVVDHVVTSEKENADVNGREREEITSVTIFSDVSKNRFSVLAGTLHSELPPEISIDVFSLDHLGRRVAKPGQIVIVEALAPTPEELDNLISTLSKSYRRSAYRGIFAGTEQRTPEEIGKPVHRKIVPGHYVEAKGIIPQPDLVDGSSEPIRVLGRVPFQFGGLTQHSR